MQQYQSVNKIFALTFNKYPRYSYSEYNKGVLIKTFSYKTSFQESTPA